MEQFTLLQFAFLFGLSVIFSVISLSRETMISYLVAGICWVAIGLLNYILDPSTLSSLALSYIFVTLGLVFILLFVKSLGNSILQRKERKAGL